MRIGLYDPYLDDIGGGEKYMMTIASCLSKDHRVEVFWDNKNDFEKVSERFALDLSNVKLTKNIFSTNVSLFSRLLNTRFYDVIIILSDGSIPLVASQKLFLHIQQPLNNLEGNSLIGKIKHFRVNGFFCNSEYTKNFLEKKLGIHPKVIYPPVAVFKKNIKKENIIMHVGRFRANILRGDYKKQEVMIDAFRDMVDKGLKNWTFVVATSINEKDVNEFRRIEKKAKGYPIKFLINKGQKEIWKIYNKAKIYWHASGFGEDLEKYPEYAEHFGISTVEAMGAGSVPVVINAGGQKEIVREGANGLLWNSLEELKEKTLEVMKDKNLWSKLSENARESAEKFSGEIFCQKVRELIK